MDSRKSEEFILVFLIQNLVRVLSVCVHVFDVTKSKKGTFTSPNFPSPYPSTAECWYTFRGSPYEGIIIEFETFDLRERKKQGCLNDYLEVYNVANNGIKHLIGRYCGSIQNIPKPIFSFQSQMEMRFKSNVNHMNTNYKGFNATYNFVPESEFRFPYYDKYFENHQLIRVKERETLTNPPKFSNPINKTILTVAADHHYTTQSNTGSSETPINADKSDDGIEGGRNSDRGGTCREIVSDQNAGYVMSPGFPHGYSPGLNCMWVIRVEKYWKIYIRIETLNLEGGLSGCNLASVKIYDGYENLVYTDTPMLNICGNVKYFENESDRSYLTGRNLAVIKFETSIFAKGLDPGFKIRWVKVSLNSTCKGIVCKGSKACLDSKHGSCLNPFKFCIDKSLSCNKVQDCPGLDNTDEEKCYFPVLVAMAVILPLVMIGTVIFCVSSRYSNKRSSSKNANSKQQHHHLGQNKDSIHRGIGQEYFGHKCDHVPSCAGTQGDSNFDYECNCRMNELSTINTHQLQNIEIYDTTKRGRPLKRTKRFLFCFDRRQRSPVSVVGEAHRSPSIHFYKRAAMSLNESDIIARGSTSLERFPRSSTIPKSMEEDGLRERDLTISTYDTLINSSSLDDYCLTSYNKPDPENDRRNVDSWNTSLTRSKTIRGIPTRV